MSANVFRGCIPALMTPCNVDRSPNFPALVAKGLELVDAGMSGVVYCGSMGDWPLLTDQQRQKGVAELVGAGVPVIVGTGAQNPKIAADHAAHAAEIGAAGLMVIPRVLSRGYIGGSPTRPLRGNLERRANLPSVIYNSPYYGFETKAELFFDLRREFTNLVGFKEFGGAAALSYASEHITSGSDDLVLMAGVDTQVFHGFIHCGAAGAITGIGNCLPKEVLHLVSLCEQAATGDIDARRKAKELDDALIVLSTFDEGPDLVLYYKYILFLLGDKDYELHFNETDVLSESQRGFVEQQLKQFQDWYRVGRRRKR